MFDFASFVQAAALVFSPTYMFFIISGVVLGIVAGILPGINGAIGMSLIIPFILGLPPAAALLMMLGLWGGENFGGGVTSILVHTPGSASGAATLLDGYPLSQRGEAGKAMGISCIASAFGWFVSALLLALLAIPLSTVALRFGPPEYFAVGIFGLSMVSSIGSRNVIKGFIAATLGLLIVTIGTDPFSGGSRFTFGRYELIDGISYLIVMIGVFALSESLVQVRDGRKVRHAAVDSKVNLPSWAEIKALIPTMTRSSLIGTFIGIVPGAGGTIAAFLAYDVAKRVSKKPEEFGHGSHEGIAAPETADNATEGGAMVPLLTMGVPGSGTAAVILAAMIMFGIRPGPELFQTQKVLVYSLFIGLLVGAVVLLVTGLLLTRWLALVVRMPQPLLVTIVTGMAFMAALTITGMLFDVRLLVVFAVVGYLMRKYDFPLASLILALVLGFMIETALRRSLIISDGSWIIFLQRPISAVLLFISLLSFATPLIRKMLVRPGARAAQPAARDGGNVTPTSRNDAT
jgi:putative tricarboxylic transport membrane protein